MRKLKTRGVITLFNEDTGKFSGVLDTEDRGYMTLLRSYVGEKQWSFEFGRFFNRPSTGDESQFHHYWGHLQQVADKEGEDIKALDERCRDECMSTTSFPFDIAAGEPVPYRLSDDRLNSQHMAGLVDFVHDFVALFYPGFELYEGDHDDKRKETAPVSIFEAEMERSLRDSEGEG